MKELTVNGELFCKKGECLPHGADVWHIHDGGGTIGIGYSKNKLLTFSLLDRLAKAEGQNERQSKALELIAESYRNIEKALMPLFAEIKERNE
jgi:hypothetical protein